MGIIRCLALGIAMLGTANAAMAEIRHVKLRVANMTCIVCQTIVEETLQRVAGVQKANVSVEAARAIVFYDDAVTSPQALIDAATNVGYPATLEIEQ